LRWVKAICSDKKRFLRQARVPFCPESRYHPENLDTCNYQPTYTADHLTANIVCEYLEIGGYLSPWTPHEVLVLGLTFWQTSPTDEGPAHFWVRIMAEHSMAMYTQPNAILAMELPAIIHEGPAAAHKEHLHPPTPDTPHSEPHKVTLASLLTQLSQKCPSILTCPWYLIVPMFTPSSGRLWLQLSL
jgi:hypothetical protein